MINFKIFLPQKLNKHAPKKRKWVKGNHTPHINKDLSKAIRKRSRFKNKPVKLEYFSSFNSTDSKQFWVNCKPYFSNNHSKSDTDTVLNENADLILKNE